MPFIDAVIDDMRSRRWARLVVPFDEPTVFGEVRGLRVCAPTQSHSVTVTVTIEASSTVAAELPPEALAYSPPPEISPRANRKSRKLQPPRSCGVGSCDGVVRQTLPLRAVVVWGGLGEGTEGRV